MGFGWRSCGKETSQLSFDWVTHCVAFRESSVLLFWKSTAKVLHTVLGKLGPAYKQDQRERERESRFEIILGFQTEFLSTIKLQLCLGNYSLQYSSEDGSIHMCGAKLPDA